MKIYQNVFRNLLQILSPVCKLQTVTFLKATVVIFAVVKAQNLTNIFQLTMTKNPEN
jgi:hypothetical protein